MSLLEATFETDLVPGPLEPAPPDPALESFRTRIAGLVRAAGLGES